MSLDSIIRVTIDRNTTTPDRQGFGTPLIAAFLPNNFMGARVREFSSLQEMVDAGFVAGDPAYRAASAIFAANPSPPAVKVGYRENAFDQSTVWYPSAPVEGETQSIEVFGPGDAFTVRSYSTQTASVTPDELDTDEGDVVDAMIIAMNAAKAAGNFDYTVSKQGSGSSATMLIATDATTYAGALYGFKATNSKIADFTPAVSGLADDMNAIQSYDDDWYGLCLDHNSTADIAAAASWVQSNKKLFVCQTQDKDVADVSEASDVASIAAALEAANYDRTMLFYHEGNLDFVCGAMLGRALSEDAGSITWAFKDLSGVSAQNLNTSQVSNCLDKNVNVFTEVAGVAVTRNGTSMEGEFMDVVRGADWLEARIKERLFGVLVQNDKLPYTDAGLQAVRGEVLAQLEEGVARDFIAADPAPECTVPRAADVSAADKGARALNNVKFRATLSGAVHRVVIEGELNL